MVAENLEGADRIAVRIDAPALDRINKILSAPQWSVGMLEDICEIVRSTGRPEVHSDYIHH
jgi:hypothetical protein